MRRIFALGLCAWYLTLGSVAGLAHVHHAVDGLEEIRGLHVDHAHLDHDHGESPTRRETDPQVENRRLDHDASDAVYLAGSAARLLPDIRLLPALPSIAPATGAPRQTSWCDANRLRQPRDPPETVPPRLRGPPA